VLETLVRSFNTQGGENLKVETISRKEAIAWIAGLLDGEGSIYAYWAPPTNGMVGPGMRVGVKISGTHPALIARCTQVLKALFVGFSVVAHKGHAEGNRASAEVIIAGKGRVKKLLLLVFKFLTEKREQAQTMLELIAYREGLAAGQVKGKAGSETLGLWNDPILKAGVQALSDQKRDFRVSVLDCSRQPGEVLGSQSSETIRRQLRLDEVMIESELHSDVQSTTETIVPQPKG
jgi:hypothetical protein